MTEMEKRFVNKTEIRAGENGEKTLVGYAAVFNSVTRIGEWFDEEIAPGAFADTIKGDVRCLFDHRSNQVLGRTKSGTLRLEEDDHGLRFEVDLPDTQLGRDVATLVERGDVSGMSFDFRAMRQSWDQEAEPPRRLLEKVEITEISIVAFPAYEDTEVALRSLEAAKKQLEESRDEVEQKKANAAAAQRRIAEKRALMEQKIRGIRQEPPKHPA